MRILSLALPVIFFLLATAVFTETSSANSSSDGILLVANKGEQTLGIIDSATHQQIATVPEEGTTGHEVAASPDGRLAFVPIYGNSGVGKPGTDGRNIIVIDIAARKKIGSIDFGRGVRPHCAVFGPRDGLLYVTTELENSVAIIDPATLKIVGSIPTGEAESHMLAISPDGLRGYTANVASGTVSVLDMRQRKVIAVIPVSHEVQRISVSADGAYIFTSDQNKADLVAIDSRSNSVKARIPLPAPGYGTSSTPDGHWLIVAVPGANKVAVIDVHNLTVARTIDVPAAPQEVLVRPDGRVAYVSCDASHKVAVIGTANWKVAALIDAGKLADGLAWAAPR